MNLFTSITELKEYINLDPNASFSSISPFISEAQELFIIPILGQDLYDQLVTDLDANRADLSGMDPDLKALLPYVLRPAAYYTLYLGIHQIGVSIGSIGIQDTMGDNSAPAPKWKVEDLRLNLITSADKFLELLLKFLTDNASATKYADWFTDQDLNPNAEGLILGTVEQASRYVDINDSRRIFLRMLKRIRSIESKDIPQLISQDQYDELVTQIKSDSLSAGNKILLGKIRPYIAKRALALTIPSLRLSLNDQGIQIYSSNDGITQKMAASKEDIKWLMASLTTDDDGYISDLDHLKFYLQSNSDVYPLYKASTAYTSKADPGPVRQPLNDPSNNFFSV